MTQTTLAAAVLEYLAGLTVTQGRYSGEPFPIVPVARSRFVRGTFRPGIVEAALSVARGNGKTTLTAGLACATLDGPLAMSARRNACGR